MRRDRARPCPRNGGTRAENGEQRDLHPPFVFTSFRTFALMGASPVPTLMSD